jgi:Uma2 family endonuclease
VSFADSSTEAVTRKQLSLAGWAALPEGTPGELVDGFLEDEEMPTGIHELVVVWFITQLSSWLLPRGGLVLGSEAKYALPDARGRKPDLSAFLPGAASPRLTDSLLTVPPSIAVEVLSSSPRDRRQDRLEKLGEYAAFGVRWYWLVDAEARTVEILELTSRGRYEHVADASRGRLDVPGLDGLVLDLDQLWDLVERATQEGTGSEQRS